MLAVIIDPDMSGSALLRRALVVDPPAIHWTSPPQSREYSIELKPVIPVDTGYQQRSLTAQEENLVWASLRASSELLYQF